MRNGQPVGPSVAGIAMQRKMLRKTAQRDVVKLFNVVRAAQAKGEEGERKARESRLVGGRTRRWRRWGGMHSWPGVGRPSYPLVPRKWALLAWRCLAIPIPKSTSKTLDEDLKSERLNRSESGLADSKGTLPRGSGGQKAIEVIKDAISEFQAVPSQKGPLSGH